MHLFFIKAAFALAVIVGIFYLEIKLKNLKDDSLIELYTFWMCIGATFCWLLLTVFSSRRHADLLEQRCLRKQGWRSRLNLLELSPLQEQMMMVLQETDESYGQMPQCCMSCGKVDTRPSTLLLYTALYNSKNQNVMTEFRKKCPVCKRYDVALKTPDNLLGLNIFTLGSAEKFEPLTIASYNSLQSE